MSRSGPCIAERALTNTGFEIILLCFCYSRETAADVSANCCVKVVVACLRQVVAFAPKVIKCAAYGVAQGRGAGLALL
jgi:methylmalonyl-CoA mutase cobalamin-binding subunit